MTKPGEWGIIKPSAVERGGVKGTSPVNRPVMGKEKGEKLTSGTSGRRPERAGEEAVKEGMV